MPDVFADFLSESAFADLDGVFSATFCIWRQHHDPEWRTGPIDYTGLPTHPDPDGAHQMLHVLTDPTAHSYRNFAASHFGVDLDPEPLAHIYALRPLTHDVVTRINPHATLEDLGSEVTSSGYPTD